MFLFSLFGFLLKSKLIVKTHQTFILIWKQLCGIPGSPAKVALGFGPVFLLAKSPAISFALSGMPPDKSCAGQHNNGHITYYRIVLESFKIKASQYKVFYLFLLFIIICNFHNAFGGLCYEHPMCSDQTLNCKLEPLGGSAMSTPFGFR